MSEVDSNQMPKVFRPSDPQFDSRFLARRHPATTRPGTQDSSSVAVLFEV